MATRISLESTAMELRSMRRTYTEILEGLPKRAKRGKWRPSELAATSADVSLKVAALDNAIAAIEREAKGPDLDKDLRSQMDAMRAHWPASEPKPSLGPTIDASEPEPFDGDM